jgi:DNA-binding CsgD family transcriptional regulator
MKLPNRLVTPSMSIAMFMSCSIPPKWSNYHRIVDIRGYIPPGRYTLDPVFNAAETALADTIKLLQAPGFEQALLAFLKRVAAPDNLAILIYQHAGPTEILFTQSDRPQVFAQLRSTYADGAYQLDPYFDLHLRHVPAGAYRLRDVAPDAFHRSRYFIEYYDQTTLVDELTFIAYPVPGISLNICLGRDSTSGLPFTGRQVEACHRLAPVICALAERHWSALTSHSGPADDVVNQLVTAMSSKHAIRLSRRQAEVALLVLKGHSSVSAALRLGVSAQTVKVFRKQLYSRCRISSQAELFAIMLPLLKGAV